MPCNVGSIRQIHQRLLKEGYEVSEYTLRRWIKEKIIPVTYSGNKALVSYTQVLKVLEGTKAAPATVS